MFFSWLSLIDRISVPSESPTEQTWVAVSIFRMKGMRYGSH
jgi:hypothetical protein